MDGWLLGAGGGRKGSCLMGTDFQICKDETGLEVCFTAMHILTNDLVGLRGGSLKNMLNAGGAGDRCSVPGPQKIP